MGEQVGAGLKTMTAESQEVFAEVFLPDGRDGGKAGNGFESFPKMLRRHGWGG